MKELIELKDLDVSKGLAKSAEAPTLFQIIGMCHKINEVKELAGNNSIAKGFWEDRDVQNNDVFGNSIALIHSELSEALESKRASKMPTGGAVEDLYRYLVDAGDSFISDRLFSPSTKNYDWDLMFEKLIKDTIPDEFADVILRIFDLCKQMGIDIGKHIILKMAYNSGRPRKHGKEF